VGSNYLQLTFRHFVDKPLAKKLAIRNYQVLCSLPFKEL